MLTLDKQIEFVRNVIHLGENENLDTYREILSSLQSIKCNTLPLHLEQKKCASCGQSFLTKNKLRECCNDKCRVSLHRARTRLKNFNQRVEQILREKNINAQFMVEQIITSSRKCPFVVYYDGNKYESESTRNLLTKLKNI